MYPATVLTFGEREADVGRQLPVPATFLYLKSPCAPLRGFWWSPSNVRCTQGSVRDAFQTALHSILSSGTFLRYPALGISWVQRFSFYLHDFGSEQDDQMIPLQDLLV